MNLIYVTSPKPQILINLHRSRHLHEVANTFANSGKHRNVPYHIVFIYIYIICLYANIESNLPISRMDTNPRQFSLISFILIFNFRFLFGIIWCERHSWSISITFCMYIFLYMCHWETKRNNLVFLQVCGETYKRVHFVYSHMVLTKHVYVWVSVCLCLLMGTCNM